MRGPLNEPLLINDAGGPVMLRNTREAWRSFDAKSAIDLDHEVELEMPPLDMKVAKHVNIVEGMCRHGELGAFYDRVKVGFLGGIGWGGGTLFLTGTSLVVAFAIQRFVADTTMGPEDFRNPAILGRGQFTLYFDRCAGACALIFALPTAARGLAISVGRRKVQQRTETYAAMLRARHPEWSDAQLSVIVENSISLARAREDKYIQSALLRAVVHAERELNERSWKTVHPLFLVGATVLGIQGAVNVFLSYFVAPQPEGRYTKLYLEASLVQGLALMSVTPVTLYTWWHYIRLGSHSCTVRTAQNRVVLMLLYISAAVGSVMYYSYAQNGGGSNLAGAVCCSVVLPLVYVYYKLRANVETQALRAVAGDYQRYQSEWSQYLQGREESNTATNTNTNTNTDSGMAREALRELEDLIAEIEASRSASEDDEVEGIFQPSDNLSEVYSHAQAHNASFQNAVQRWADETGGKCHRCDALKKLPRAVNKVWRCYGGHPRRLTDVVRSSIEYHTIGGVVRGLRLVRACEQYRIVRVKNRFAPAYDARKSAGYRDLSMNLRERETGLVVELQFHLDRMIAIKSDAGHKRYVIWRDAMAE